MLRPSPESLSRDRAAHVKNHRLIVKAEAAMPRPVRPTYERLAAQGKGAWCKKDEILRLDSREARRRALKPLFSWSFCRATPANRGKTYTLCAALQGRFADAKKAGDFGAGPVPIPFLRKGT
jgi:hypothetical protein